MERAIHRFAPADQDDLGILRASVIPLDKTLIPTVEEFYVVAPNIVPRKVAARFDEHWPFAVRHQRWAKVRANPQEDYDYRFQEKDDREEQSRYECEMSDIIPEP
jgi:hypothetical protein